MKVIPYTSTTHNQLSTQNAAWEDRSSNPDFSLPSYGRQRTNLTALSLEISTEEKCVWSFEIYKEVILMFDSYYKHRMFQCGGNPGWQINHVFPVPEQHHNAQAFTCSPSPFTEVTWGCVISSSVSSIQSSSFLLLDFLLAYAAASVSQGSASSLTHFGLLFTQRN